MFFTLLLRPQRIPSRHLTRSMVATLIALCVAAGARAQTVDPNMWVTDGGVSAIATAGNTIYLGGNFTYVGPNTGHFAGIDIGTGAAEPGWPRVDGDVYCSASDGAGGWYIGGLFTSVGGVGRGKLANTLADKTLDAWNLGASNEEDR